MAQTFMVTQTVGEGAAGWGGPEKDGMGRRRAGNYGGDASGVVRRLAATPMARAGIGARSTKTEPQADARGRN